MEKSGSINGRYAIGIIGYGVVGKAVAFGFSPIADIMHNDPESPNSEEIECLCEKSDFIFVCVPTPEDNDGSVNIDIMDKVLQNIKNANARKPIIIKSTITPDLLVMLRDRYHMLRLMYNPEFLTERTAPYDFINQTRIILGGNHRDTAVVAELYEKRFPHVPIYHCDIEAAAIVKYMCNCFFALKLSFMNEWYGILEASGSNTKWEDIADMFFGDYRVGNSHMDIPGPDGKMGWGGKCFPKDTAGAVAYAKEIGAKLLTIQAARLVNTAVRGKQTDPDWIK